MFVYYMTFPGVFMSGHAVVIAPDPLFAVLAVQAEAAEHGLELVVDEDFHNIQFIAVAAYEGDETKVEVFEDGDY